MMTPTDDDIKMTSAADAYADELTTAPTLTRELVRLAFCAGVRWADKNPKTTK